MVMTRTGLAQLVADGCELLKGRRVGLVANHTAIDHRFNHAADVLHAALGDGLKRLFAPEHGLRGDAQDQISIDTGRDRRTGLEAVSLYGTSEQSLMPPAGSLADLDVIVFDIQDIGARYYTYQATMALVMRAAREHGLGVVVLDRPNPIGGHVTEGNVVAEGFESFVGFGPLAVRHGMTVGELAEFYARFCGLECDLTVVPVGGWQRDSWWDATRLPWVMPSPNMPTLDTAIVYPGLCLIEGTNLSEGRGTTRPFELFGAPWLDGHQLRLTLEAEELPGVEFREAVFRPGFHKHAGLPCEGVQLHVRERERFLPFRTGLAVIRAARAQSPERFDWRRETYEFVSDRLAFDLLCGTDRVREQLEGDVPLDAIEASWAHELGEFEERRRQVLLYS